MEEQPLLPNQQVLKDLVWYRMPFGKYKGTLVRELPIYYLEWFSTKGFPKGKLGMLLSTMFIIRTHGLDDLLLQMLDFMEQE